MCCYIIWQVWLCGGHTSASVEVFEAPAGFGHGAIASISI